MQIAIRKIIACTSALALVCALVPLTAIADEGSGQPAMSTPSNIELIDEMLQAGDFADGEAIVVVDNTVGANDVGPLSRSVSPLDAAEPLIGISAETYEETTGETVADPIAAANGVSTFSFNDSTPDTRANESAGALSIVLVKQEGTSTADLLRELAQDPRVVSAEPNYLISLPDREATSSDAGNPPALATDLSDYQWMTSNNGERLSIPHNGKTALANFDINESTWTGAKETGWSEIPANASGTVAVVDTGIDYTHPDLQDIMWDGQNLAALAGEGGSYGMNVSGSGNESDVMDRNEHGTHCAGIIASSWDGNGTSGVANGVKLVAVKMLDDNGFGSLAMELRAYDYLTRIATAVNLKAVNNSWGGHFSYLALSLAVTELGRMGAVSVFATGNDSVDTDEGLFTAATLAANPYAVAINSSDVTGQLSAFSNYGAYTTDFAAPGSSILSTVPTTMRHFFPEVADAAQLTAYETFAGETPPRTSTSSAAAGVIGSADDALHYDESASWSVKLADMDRIPDEELANMGLASSTKASFAYAFDLSVNIPESSASFASEPGYLALKCLNACFKSTTTNRMFIGALGVNAVAKDGSVQLAVNDASQTMTGRARMVDGWTPLSLNVGKLLEDAGMSGVALDDAGNMTVRMVVLLPYEPQADDTVNFDCIGIGSGEESIGSYDVLNGTSMAAPVATGAAAVLAYGEPASSDVLANQGADALAAAAAQRAARLKGSTSPSEEFAGTCRSNGALDLGVSEAEYTPSITGAQVSTDEQSVTVNGFFFGEGGNASAISIDGKSASVTSWSETAVTVKRPDGQQSGGTVISLTAANGKTAQAKVELLFSDDSSDAPLYEKVLTSPAKSDGFMDEDLMFSSFTALDGSLYLLTINAYVAQGLWRYDIASDAWNRCADLPENLVCSTGALAAFDSSVMLLGTLESEEESMQLLYRYDPRSDTWSETLYEENVVYSSVVTWKDSLLLVGGVEETGYVGIRAYDPQTGDAALLADLPTGTMLPSLTVSDGNLVVAQGVTNQIVPQPGLLMRAGEADGTWTAEQLDSVLPSENPYGAAYGFYGLAGYAGGAAVVGLPEPGSDTALLADDARRLEPFGKTLSTDPVYSASAVAYDGYLYALAASNLDPDRVVFRATAIDTGTNGGGGEGDDPGAGGGGQAASESKDVSAKPLVSTGDTTTTSAQALATLGIVALFVGAWAVLRVRRTGRS